MARELELRAQQSQGKRAAAGIQIQPVSQNYRKDPRSGAETQHL